MTPDLWAGISGPGWSPYGEYQLMTGAKYMVGLRGTLPSARRYSASLRGCRISTNLFVGRRRIQPTTCSVANRYELISHPCTARQGTTIADTLRAAIQQHREDWVTAADFATLAAFGMNAVRLPIG